MRNSSILSCSASWLEWIISKLFQRVWSQPFAWTSQYYPCLSNIANLQCLPSQSVVSCSFLFSHYLIDIFFWLCPAATSSIRFGRSVCRALPTLGWSWSVIASWSTNCSAPRTRRFVLGAFSLCLLLVPPPPPHHHPPLSLTVPSFVMNCDCIHAKKSLYKEFSPSLSGSQALAATLCCWFPVVLSCFPCFLDVQGWSCCHVFPFSWCPGLVVVPATLAWHASLHGAVLAQCRAAKATSAAVQGNGRRENVYLRCTLVCTNVAFYAGLCRRLCTQYLNTRQNIHAHSAKAQCNST